MMLKIMVPVSIIVKLLQISGGIEIIGSALAPIMKLVGLPGEMGLVWATGMITNLFGGVIAFINLSGNHPLTVAQITILATMMLVAHTFPIELQIARKSGLKLITMLFIRFGFAFLFGLILHTFYSQFNLLGETAIIKLKPDLIQDLTILGWIKNELKNYLIIFLFIFSLMFLIKLLKVLGIIKLITKLISPLLRFLGISESVTTITIVGLTLGIVYGGVLIINESKSNEIKRRDIFYSMTLMGLCHSVIEDSILMISIGGHYSGIIIGRIILSLIITFIIVKITSRFSDALFGKLFLNKVKI
ncbi:MAG: hypothetical protein HXX09_15445 [Bacteroidetes bacterium]|nr:hypothetical protein [Bacteroidota bacterium]